ncbi:MAG: hypothetical protein WAN65_25505 [Candidatus Sulfotelmatobacter sp.]
MLTKVCTNQNCPAYVHFVFTLGMRCVLCRWGLKAAHRNPEAARAEVRRKSAEAWLDNKEARSVDAPLD